MGNNGYGEVEFWELMNGDKVHKTLAGKKPTRSRKQYPYAYSAYAIWNSGEWSPEDDVVYSDRLPGFYGDKYYELGKELGVRGGLSMGYTDPEILEKFLSELFDCKIKLTGIEEEGNASNGYPYWLLYYREEK